MQARFSILKCFLEAGDNFVTLSSTRPDYDDLVIIVDRSKINSHGKPAVGKYLQKLNIYKSTADVDAGTKMYASMTEVDGVMAQYRDVVLRKKQPRKQFVEANTFLKEDGEVELKQYDATCEGFIQSYVERSLWRGYSMDMLWQVHRAEEAAELRIRYRIYIKALYSVIVCSLS